jgi:hypothetical protein
VPGECPAHPGVALCYACVARARSGVDVARRPGSLELQAERGLRALPPGYDIRSVRRGVDSWPNDVRHIEVKGDRWLVLPTVTVSRNEILTSMNEPDRFILALVAVAAGGDTVRYLRRPFEGRSEDSVFEVTSVDFTWSALWQRAETPS